MVRTNVFPEKPDLSPTVEGNETILFFLFWGKKREMLQDSLIETPWQIAVGLSLLSFFPLSFVFWGLGWFESYTPGKQADIPVDP